MGKAPSPKDMTNLETKSAPSWVTIVLITIAVLVVILPALYVAAAMLALKAHTKDDCGMQLRNIGMRCRMHAMEHNGQFPSKWSELEWDDMEGIENTSWDRQFVCPTAGHGVSDWKQVDQWADYRLIPGRTTNDSPDAVLAIEPLDNHKTGANVLFVDGSSAWWPAARVIEQKGRKAPEP
jgi:prepilin-type processing-associated H-X9-DG protein